MAENNETYEPKAKITEIQATSRMSIKVKDNFFTIEYQEKRVIPDIKGVDIDKEREALWDAVNNECDSQAETIYNTFSN
jgi:hypothetical protein